MKLSSAVVIPVFFLFLGCNSGFKSSQPGASAPATTLAPDGQLSGDKILGTITIDPSLAKNITPSSVIFVMAKPAEQGPPVAVKRLPLGTFPMSFELTAQDVMMPNVPFQGNFFIIVRIDKDGMAGPAQKGDMEGRFSRPIPVGHPSVAVKISKVY